MKIRVRGSPDEVNVKDLRRVGDAVMRARREAAEAVSIGSEVSTDPLAVKVLHIMYPQEEEPGEDD